MSAATKTGPSLRLAIAVLVAGALLGVPLVVRLVSSVANVVTEEAYETPARFTRHLDTGRYVVFVRTATGGAQTVGPGQVHVVGVDGRGDELPTAVDRASETITRGDAVFTGAVVVDVATPGDYELTVDGEGRDVLVTRSLGDAAEDLGRPFALALVGATVFVLGLALLVVGLVRRRRPPPVTATPASTPAGWYQAPDGGGRRYWDGTSWTEHTSP